MRRARLPSLIPGLAPPGSSAQQNFQGSRRSRLPRVPEPLCLRERLELLQRVVLDLPDALAGHVEGAADFLERVGALAGEAEAELDDLALALRQRGQSAAEVLAAQVLGGELEGRFRRLVLDEIAELGVLLLADRLLERDGLLGHAEDVADLAGRGFELGGDLL